MRRVSLFTSSIIITLQLACFVGFVGCSKEQPVAKVVTKQPEQTQTVKTVTLRLAEVHAEGYPTALADQEFARLVEERTQGRVKIEVFTGGVLYKEEPGAIEALQIGDLAFTRVSASPVAAYVPKLNVIQLPYLYKNAQHMWDVLNGPIGQGMLEEIEESGSGLVGLCYYDSGARSFYLTKEVHSVEDLAGLKIRVQNNPLSVSMCEALGATGAVGIGTGDVYKAIQTGAVDGAENNWPTYENMGDYKVAKYYVLDQHTRVPELLLGSSVALNRLDSSDVDIIKDVAKETQEYEIARWAEKEAESEKIVREAGNTIIELTPEEYAEFQEKMKPIYEEYGGEYKDIVESIQATE